jgi:ribosomal protein S18 acetylase RimI-like enzyme
MTSAISLRLMTESDLGFADSLRALAGWNQTLEDWRRFIASDPDGCFVAEHNGSPAGTVTTIRYEKKIGWIGMLLVHPSQRRLGFGRTLLEHAISHLKNSCVETIKLDATPQGQILYEKIGFVEEWTLTRWRGFASGLKPFYPKFRVGEAPKVAALDALAFGANRIDLLTRLAPQSETLLIEEKGFGMIRKGSIASYLGPLVANSSETAFLIADALMRSGETILDIPDENSAAVSWIQSRGFLPQRQLIRMRLGPEIPAAAPHTLFAIASPETG